MINLSKVDFQSSKKPKTGQKGLFWGLTFYESIWGPLLEPTHISSTSELVDRFGNYDATLDNKSDFMQAWNFLEYSTNLKIYRVGTASNNPIFSTNVLTGMGGNSNSHLFLDSVTGGDTSVWNSSDNGSDVFIRLGDMTRHEDEPTYGTDQVCFCYAKYTGALGNQIGISTANYLDVLSEKYVWNQTSWTEIDLVDVSNFVAGGDISGETSGASGTISAVNGNRIEIIYTEGSVAFVSGENVDNVVSFVATETTCSNIDNYDKETNFSFDDILPRSLVINEFAVAITVDNILKDVVILSMDNDKPNYIEDFENPWIGFFVDTNLTIAVDTDDTATKYGKIPVSVTKRNLRFGANDMIPNTEIAELIGKLSSVYFADYDVIFSENNDNVIKDAIDTLADERFIIPIINNYGYVDYGYLIDNYSDFITTHDGYNIIIVG